MPKEFPKGAITSPIELLRLKGKPVWEASRTHKSVNVFDSLNGLIGNDNSTFEYLWFGHGAAGRSSMKDRNVVENDYNDWFLFAEKDDADAYVAQ